MLGYSSIGTTKRILYTRTSSTVILNFIVSRFAVTKVRSRKVDADFGRIRTRRCW